MRLYVYIHMCACACLRRVRMRFDIHVGPEKKRESATGLSLV